MTTSSAWDVDVLLADGTTWLGLTLAQATDARGLPVDGAPRTVADALSAASVDTPIVQDLVTTVVEDLSGGVGVDYDQSPGVECEIPGYALPAGAATPVQVPSTSHSSNTPIVAFAEYNGDLYVAQQGSATASRGGRVMRLTGGTGTLSEVLTLAASNYVRDIMVADDGSGTTVLFVTSESLTHTNARLHKFDGSLWTSTTAGTEFASGRGLGRMGYVYWKTDDGVGDWRIVAITGPKTIAYTLPDADPMTGTATWSADITIGTTGTLTEIIAFRRHIFIAATDGLYDVNELGESEEITSFLRRMLQVGNGGAVEHLDGYIYMAVGRGLIRTFVGNPGNLDEDPLGGQCAPAWNTPSWTDGRGYTTALCIDQGRVVDAIYNPSTQKSYIFWGTDRNVAKKDVPQPMVWHGPKVLIAVDYKVTRMVTSGLAGDLRLWIASQSVAGSTPRLDWVSLPLAGSSIQDLVSGGTHRFAPGDSAGDILQPYCRLELLRDTGGDKAKNKHLYQYSVGSLGLDSGSGTKLTLQARADPAIGSTTYTSQGDITTGPTQDVTPATVVSGHTTQLRVDFISPSGDAAAAADVKVAVLDSLRTLRWDVAPAFNVVKLDVQYGAGVTNRHGAEDTERSPDFKTAQLKLLTEAKATTVRMPDDQEYTVKFRQVLDGQTEHFTNGKRETKRLVGSVVAGPL